jgi:IS4 transposase
MCKLCERDKPNYQCVYDHEIHSIVRKDRLAVLEKDHRAMERLRSGKVQLSIQSSNVSGHSWSAHKSNMEISGDPADAILVVEKKEG